MQRPAAGRGCALGAGGSVYTDSTPAGGESFSEDQRVENKLEGKRGFRDGNNLY